MATGTLYTYPENFRAYKVQAAANYSGFKLSVDGSFQYGTTNKTAEFMSKFPLGRVPAFESSTGVCLNESNAIALFVANEQLAGKSKEDQAKVMQWMNFADQEILPAVCTWVFPCMGFMQFNKSNTDKSKDEILAVMKTLNDTLATKTFLVGERVTLADLSVATTLLLAYQHVMEPAFRSPFPNVNRWFETVINQPQVKKALPTDFKMCEKMAQFDAKKYAEMSGGDNKKKDDKKNKKPAAKKETPKKDKKPAEAAAEPAAEPPKEKKKDPFLAFPAPENWIWDEWKKTYSNENIHKVAVPWFFEHFDAEKMSIWYGVYNEELSGMDFQCTNLIGGMFQRLDGMRKHTFGVHCYFNAPTKRITGVYVTRGNKLPFSLADDLNVDAPSYKWKQLDISNAADKQLVTDYLLWDSDECEGTFEGFEMYEGRVWK